MAGLLIVNADDFGGNPLATERIAECFSAGRVTSTTAMMFMGDSERAARIAGSQRLPTGLHLNLTQPFEDPGTPRAVQERQAQAIRHLAGRRLARYTFNPLLTRLVRRCIADQLDRFHELFGHDPTHIDSHNHAHLSPSVLLALPRGVRIRTAESPVHATLALGRLMRRARRTLIAHRQLTTDHFFAIDRLGSSPTLPAMHELVAMSDHASVEIMVHPDRDSDYRLLMSDAWAETLRGRGLGSFADLGTSRSGRS
jgi:predicted glycoside hydrolase/deacetylase ChbG (UPF0249 family)